ncbi:MAG: DUF4342 domain-containing protein [Bacteroidales bacterium]|jgi:hypothetical protein|nr:DUF4342 domain-containing protein [Bacteroidales bacterium]
MAEFKEEFKVKGKELLDKIKDIIHEGNIRRVVIKNDDGKTIMEFPVTFGVIGAVIAPILAAVGAVAALAADYTIEVYKTGDDEEKKNEQPGK